ncbi:hypothetical protein HMPREF0322_02856 [Desulfitobacterium hafniense DP7]|uniref:Uncharacterized protein n=1 Tax=Desulfitobacterium hafniense DP7 TaxID=537010 RepID=G9XPG0_DESHA|nr:hypothetical protein HMPREF0322_02856 [Desulfitobacterium hafniense DP7]
MSGKINKIHQEVRTGDGHRLGRKEFKIFIDEDFALLPVRVCKV